MIFVIGEIDSNICDKVHSAIDSGIIQLSFQDVAQNTNGDNPFIISGKLIKLYKHIDITF